MAGQVEVYRICDESIAADGAVNNFPVEDSEGNIALHNYEQITFLVDIDVGAGSESVVFDVDVAAEEDGDWFDTTIHDLTAATAKDIQADDITITADTQEAAIALSNPAPYVRLNITNNGDNAATVTVWVLVA